MDPITLNKYGTILGAAGSFSSAFSAFEYGDAAEKAGSINAMQLRQRAGLAMAGSERQAYDINLQAKYTASRAIALAAASGGGASDPTVVNLMAQNAGQAAYKQAMALWQGQEQARQLDYTADVSEYEGKLKKSQAVQRGIMSMFQGGASIMKGSATEASLYQRFGAGGPDEDQ